MLCRSDQQRTPVARFFKIRFSTKGKSMTAVLAWKPPRSAMSNNFSGLLDKLVAKLGISECDQAEFQSFINEAGNGVALLTEEPDTAPESWDMAVIFPELLAAIGTQLR